jgi:hypothetical protein
MLAMMEGVESATPTSGAGLSGPCATRKGIRDGRPEWRLALAIALLGAVVLALVSSLMTREAAPRGDDEIYERMAAHPLATHTFPFAYRIGLPWLVHILPFSHTTSFRLLDWLATGAAAGVAYLLMRRLGARAEVALGLALCLALSPPMLLVSLRNGRNTDAATLFFMLTATLLLVERRLRALTLTLAIGVLFREAELFIIPLAYAVWAVRPLDLSALRRALLCGLPAIALYIALHLGISSVGEAKVPGYGGSLLAERATVIKEGLKTLLTELRRMLSIYGPLWIAAPLALRGMSFARRGLVLVAACLVSMTFALDWGRMILLASPVFYPAAAHTLTLHPRWRTPAFLAFAVLIAGYAIYMQHSGVRTGIIENPPPPYPVR